ncbi:MAG TPA: di-heme-cytochrome C peroxidase, partial [Gemmatimonadales bacterium]|nr:di-heme-cytochrome C peroxidase [Gemmatimonadales bacterium]
VEDFHREATSAAFTQPAYRARPLNGIWATAPYLHNGSVPNLWQLLQPESQRVKEFYVGSRQYDPVHVGFETSRSTDTTRLDTTLTGNSNSGHTYGTQLTDAQKWDLIEYMKGL